MSRTILTGKVRRRSLMANDILFVPTSGPKTAFGRGVEAAIRWPPVSWSTAVNPDLDCQPQSENNDELA